MAAVNKSLLRGIFHLLVAVKDIKSYATSWYKKRARYSLLAPKGQPDIHCWTFDPSKECRTFVPIRRLSIYPCHGLCYVMYVINVIKGCDVNTSYSFHKITFLTTVKQMLLCDLKAAQDLGSNLMNIHIFMWPTVNILDYVRDRI